MYTFCVECGPNVEIDEDGCCVGCGRDAIGEWVNAAVAALNHCGNRCYKKYIDEKIENGNSSESR